MIGHFVLRSQKSQSLKKCQDTITGEVEGKKKKRRKNGGAQLLPEVSRVQVEEVSSTKENENH